MNKSSSDRRVSRRNQVVRVARQAAAEVVPTLELLEQRALFSTVVWDGGGADNNWTTAANWAGGVAPVSGDSLQFSGTTRTTANDDYAAGTSFGLIEFSSTGFTLTGNQASLTGGITVDSSVTTATVSLPVALVSAQSINVASGSLTIGGAVTGTGALTKSGSGTLVLSGTNAYTGGTTVTSGTVNVSGNQSAANGGWLVGNNLTSTAATVSFLSGSSVSVASGASIQLVQSAGVVLPATLNVAGSVTNSGSLSVARAGVLNINSGANWVQNGAMAISPGNDTLYGPTESINTGATFTYAGSTAITLAPSIATRNGNAVLSVAGGTFVTDQPLVDPVASSGGAADFYLSNSGALKLSANVAPFTSTAGSTFNVQISSGTGVINTNGHNGTITQPITGSGLLDKAGTGVLTLTAADTYSGGTTIAAGAILAENSTALGSGTLAVVNGNASTASLQLAGGITISNTFAGLNSETAGATPTLENISGNNTISSNLSINGLGGQGVIVQSDAGLLTLTGGLTTTLTTVRTYYLQGAGNGIVSGNITDDSSHVLQVVKSGSGSWTLTGTNTYANGTTINSGVLTATGSSVSGAIHAKSTGTFNNPAIAGAAWTDSDIGAPGIAGSVAFNTDNTYTLAGSGSDISGVADQMNFVSQPFTGDGGITAEVNASPVNTDGSTTTGSKDGIMFRDNLFSDASFVEVGYTTGTGIQMLYRDGNGATVQVGGTVTGVTGPVWLNLTRVQGVYTASYSTDGSAFSTVGTYSTENLEATALVGLVVSSHDNTKTATATFSNVAITSSQVALTTEADLSFTVPWLATSDTLVYAVDAGSSQLLADVPAGTSSVALTSLTADQSYSIQIASATAVVAAGGTLTGNTPPALTTAATTAVPTSTNVVQWTVTADSSLTEGITAADDAGGVVVAHATVYAADPLQAAQLAGVAVSGFSSHGSPSSGFSGGVVEAGNTGHTAPFYEESLAELLGIAGSTPIFAVEDGTDGDFNDAYASLTITEV